MSEWRNSFNLRGVVGFTLDSSIGEYVLTRPNIEHLGSSWLFVKLFVKFESFELVAWDEDWDVHHAAWLIRMIRMIRMMPYFSGFLFLDLRIPSRGKIYSCNEAERTGFCWFVLCADQLQVPLYIEGSTPGRPTLKTGTSPSKTTLGTEALIFACQLVNVAAMKCVENHTMLLIEVSLSLSINRTVY